jgi:hypothetical protein
MHKGYLHASGGRAALCSTASEPSRNVTHLFMHKRRTLSKPFDALVPHLSGMHQLPEATRVDC